MHFPKRREILENQSTRRLFLRKLISANIEIVKHIIISLQAAALFQAI